jgi:hypothetical protein
MEHTMSDPFANAAGNAIPEKPMSAFWQPETPEYLVGVLDNTKTIKRPNGDRGEIAIFRDVVLFRANDHRPIAKHDSLTIGTDGPSLTGRILQEGVGQYYRVQFTGWEPTKQGRKRNFNVTSGLTADTTKAILDRARRAVPSSTEDEANDHLPF